MATPETTAADDMWEQLLVRKRLAAFPQAAALATALGHPEWVVGADLLRPATATQYTDAVAACRARGLQVDEHEKILEVRRLRGVDDNDEEDVTEVTTVERAATVVLDGRPITLDGGVQERRVAW